MVAGTGGPDRLAYALSRRRLRAWMAAEDGLDGVLDTAFGFRGVGEFRSLDPVQRRGEARALTERVAERDPDTVVEIGTYAGGTLYLWCRALDAATYVSVDLPGGPFGGGYSPRRAAFYRSFAPGADVHTLRRDSHDPDTAARLREILDGRGIDFLFLDGDHTYEGVREDFETYGRLVNHGGIAALHDVLPQSHRPDSRVYEFWAEIEPDHRTEEIVTDRYAGWGGIGVVYL